MDPETSEILRALLQLIAPALGVIVGAVTGKIINKRSNPDAEGQQPGKSKTKKSQAEIDEQRASQTESKRATIIVSAVIGGVVGLLIGYFLISPMLTSPNPTTASTSPPNASPSPTTKSSCPPSAPTKIAITSPASESSVPRLVTVQGTACNIPEGKELWLLVVPDGVTGYYPQTGPVVISSDGSWSGSAYIGSDTRADNGRGFALMAVLADQQGSAAIRAYFTQRGDYIGLEPLPQGVQVMTQVRVVRR